jgi:thymidine phosphorylase
VTDDHADARTRLERAISSGKALEKFREIVIAQGGDPGVCDDPSLVVPAAKLREAYVSPRDGVVQRVEPRAVGKGITAMGGGRTKMADLIDPAVGFQLLAKPGDRVSRGQPLATILARDAACAAAGRAALDAAFVVGDGDMPRLPLISHRVTANGVERLA